MLRSFMKMIYFSLQLIVCLLLILEKTQADRFPALYYSSHLPMLRPIYKQPRYRIGQPPRRRLLSWRQFFFLLGYQPTQRR